MRRKALRHTRDASDADDVVQEAAVKAWQKIRTLREPAKARAWMLQIVAREALHLIDTRRQEHELTEDAAMVAGPDRDVDRFDLHEGIGTALRALPRQAAHAWILREVDGLSYRDIAGRLNAPESSVRGWLSAARKRVQEAIDSCCPSARPLPPVSGLPIGTIATPLSRPTKSAVATYPPARTSDAHAVAELRSPIHQDLDMSSASRTLPATQTD